MSPGGLGLGSLDLHVHTDMSDGDLGIEEVVTIAEARGVTLGVSDHVSSRNPARFVSDQKKLAHYLETLGSYDVLKSAELCWLDPFSESLPPSILEEFDYVIGSNHGFLLPDGTMGSPWWRELPSYWAGRPDDLMENLVRNVCEIVATMPISIIAHPTLIPPALLALDGDVEVWWTEDREARFVAAAVANGVAIEISNRYRLPHPRLLAKAREAGARFSLGSDGHERKQVVQLGWAVEAAKAAGIRNEDLFVPPGLG